MFRKRSQNSQENTSARVSYLIKLQESGFIYENKLFHTSSRSRCSSVNLLHIFRTPFPRNTSGWLLLTFFTEHLGTTVLPRETAWLFLKWRKLSVVKFSDFLPITFPSCIKPEEIITIKYCFKQTYIKPTLYICLLPWNYVISFYKRSTLKYLFFLIKILGNNDFVQKIGQIVSMRTCRIAVEFEGNGSGWIKEPKHSKIRPRHLR